MYKELLPCLLRLSLSHCYCITQTNKQTIKQFFILDFLTGDFIPAAPKEILKNADLLAKTSLPDVPQIIGVNDQEGSLLLAMQLYMGIPDEMLQTSAMFRRMASVCLKQTGKNFNEVVMKVSFLILF